VQARIELMLRLLVPSRLDSGTGAFAPAGFTAPSA